MKIRLSKHKSRFSMRKSDSATRVLRYAHSQHIESHLGKKQQQEKNPIVFLFSQLRFNNVISHALFYGGHLVMRSKRCACKTRESP